MDGPTGEAAVTGCGPLISGQGATIRPLRLQIFEHVRAFGSLSRAQVAKDLNVSPGTVSTLTAELIEQRFLYEEPLLRDPTDISRGRPPMGLSVRADARIVAGLKLSDREYSGIIVDFSGRQLASISVRGRSGQLPLKEQIEAMDRLLTELLQAAGLERQMLAGLGLGLPGFVDHDSGRVFWSPVLAGRGVDVAAAATAALGVPVTIDNDANLVALAELWFGAGRQKSDFAVVTIEHGVGTGVVLNHKLFRGAHGLGVELGHTKVQLDGALCRCGQRGCLEAYISDYALAREAAAALDAIDAPLPPRDMIERLFHEARDGNEAAQSIFRRAGRYLALGLANIVNLFDPSLLILSGVRMRYDYLYADEVLAEMETFVLKAGREMPPVQVQEWGDLMWAHGAAALALSMVTEAELGAPRESAA